MKLQRLELFGFKSFPDRVTIEFNPGITAIVGPNGCGKSNLSDAIRWVLGEQRPTMVRGSKMDEVIFSGTRDRSAINLAEATLVFANDDGALPVDYSEVAVSRRVFREGEGEYFLNRQPCRLKDIQDLFYGTGIGAHAYSLIQQGMVDTVLSDRTEERRTIFEEAAGVTRYKNRRRATERKLEATSRDLERVEDIVAEVEKTVRSLGRQVGRTRRYRRYEAEERRLDLLWVAREMESIEARFAPLVEELRGLETGEAERAARIAELEAELESVELAIVEERDAERADREVAEGLRARIARREESRLVTGETLKHNRARLVAIGDEDVRADGRASELAERRDALEAERASAAGRLERVVERLGDEDGDDVEARRAELRAERGAVARELEGLRERRAEIRQAIARHASAEEATAERLAAVEAELEERRRVREEAEGDAARAAGELEAAEAERAAAGAEVVTRREAAAAGTRDLEEARARLAAERAAEQAAEGRLQTLGAIEARFEGYARGSRALLADGASTPGIAGALPQAVEPREPRFERPLERYLESLGHGLLARDRGAAVRAARRLEEDGGGRADFLIPEFLANGPAPELPDEAAAVVVARGLEALRWTGDPALYDALAPLFGRLLVVADRDAAFRCREAMGERSPAAHHYVVAGLDGSLLEPTGRWGTGGGVDDEGLLARRRRLAEARAEAEARRLSVEAASAAVGEAEEARGAAQTGLEAALETLEAAEDRRRVAREAVALAGGRAEQLAARVAELEEEAAGLTAARERAVDALAELAAREAEVEADVARVEQRLAAVGEALERLETARIDRQSERHEVELERARAEAELAAIERELEHVAAAESALEAARERRAAERADLEAANDRLETERAAAGGEIEELYAELDVVEKRLRERGEGTAALEEKRTARETELRGLRREHETAVETRHERALARQSLEHRRRSLLEHVSETYGEADLDALLERHPPADGEADLPLEELRERLEEVRRKRANLGPVNMLALEEHERESERLEFLVAQRDDLLDAKRQLEEAIRRINATARRLFEETFAEIASNFDAVFRGLFEGGTAEVRLADPDDPLESPIEIVASPRGKRIQHINLLSGGERALTALALLFAIYHVKPSPFCVLDEVDAPLDDANVGRFLKMIRHFSERTQFVVITHNRRTMEAADWLYGVTMEEPGVSTLVSVALEGDGTNGDGGDNGNGRRAAEGPLEEVLSATG